LSYARNIAPRAPDEVVPNPASPEMTSVLVTRVPTLPSRPVRGMLRPLRAGLFLTLSGVSPCATCQMISPLLRSMALICPYGGFMMGSPRTDRAPPPPPPPADPVAGAPARPPGPSAPAPAPDPPVVRAPVAALPCT